MTKLSTQVRKASKMAQRSFSPKSVQEDNRSIQFVISTENPVRVFDWDSWGFIDEVLLMTGCEFPNNEAVPLLNTHNQWDTTSILGSCRDFEIENKELLARAYFSSVSHADDNFTLVKEGHLTDVSVGYEVLEYRNLKENEVYEHEGIVYEGPLRLVTKWALKEVSLCPIGADPDAKARNKNNFMEEQMNGLKKRAEEATNDELKEELLDDELENEVDDLDNDNADDPDDDDLDDAARAESADDEMEEKRSAEVKRAALLEKKRCKSIIGLCRQHSMPQSFEDNCIDKNLTLSQVRKLVLDSKVDIPMPGFISQGTTEQEKFRAAAVDGLLARCGIFDKDKKDNGSEHFRGLTLKEFAREVLHRSGQSVPSNPLDMVGRALTTTDFPVMLTQVANKTLIEGWNEYQSTWQLWCGTGSTNDFKPQTLVNLSLGQTLDEIKEGDEYKYSKAAEEAESVQVATYGKILTLSRQAIINDDLNAFSQIPKMHGQAAARTINKLAYDVLKNNKALADKKALFHADHNNLIKTNNGIVDVTKLNKAFAAMKLQKNALKESMQVIPQYFIAPVSIEGGCETFFTSPLLGTQANPNQTNIYHGPKLVRVYDSMLDELSTADWYLAGQKGNTVTMFFLHGNTTPRLEEKQGWKVDGVEFKVSIDCAGAPIGYQYLSKSTS